MPHRYKIYILFSICIVVGFGILYLISNNYYPIMIVNGEPISAHRFWQIYASTAHYYQSVLTTYQDSGAATSTPSQQDLEASALSQLVDSTLVAEGARQEVGKDLPALVSDRVEKYRENQDLAQATEALYGLSYSDFESEVLVPQAEKDILSGRLFLRGQKIDDWLTNARKSAQITILSGGFSWNGQSIVPK